MVFLFPPSQLNNKHRDDAPSKEIMQIDFLLGLSSSSYRTPSHIDNDKIIPWCRECSTAAFFSHNPRTKKKLNKKSEKRNFYCDKNVRIGIKDASPFFISRLSPWFFFPEMRHFRYSHDDVLEKAQSFRHYSTPPSLNDGFFINDVKLHDLKFAEIINAMLYRVDAP